MYHALLGRTLLTMYGAGDVPAICTVPNHRNRRRVSFGHYPGSEENVVFATHTYSYHDLPALKTISCSPKSNVSSASSCSQSKCEPSLDAAIPERFRGPRVPRVLGQRNEPYAYGTPSEIRSCVLVTDAAGPLGSWVVRMLLEAGIYRVAAAVSVVRRDYLRSSLDAEQVCV